MRTGYLAFGLAAVVGVVPASFAQDSRVLDHDKPAGTAIESKERQTQQRLGSKKGISLAVPIGRILVSPEIGDSEPVYVRRMTVREGMTVVEVSTTPFVPVLASNEEAPGGVKLRPDQPAGW